MVSTHQPIPSYDRDFDDGIDFACAPWSGPALALFARLVEALGRGGWPGEVRVHDVDELNAAEWSMFHAVWGHGSRGHGEAILHVDGSVVATASSHEGIEGLLTRAFQQHRGDLERRLDELGFELQEDEVRADIVRERLQRSEEKEGRDYDHARVCARVFAGPRGAHFVESPSIGTYGAYLPENGDPEWIGSAWSSSAAFIWLHERAFADGLLAHVSQIHEPEEFATILERLRTRARPAVAHRVRDGTGSIGPFVGTELWGVAGSLVRLGLSTCAAVRFEAFAPETPMVVSDREWRALRREYRRALVADDAEAAARLRRELAQRYGDDAP